MSMIWNVLKWAMFTVGFLAIAGWALFFVASHYERKWYVETFEAAIEEAESRGERFSWREYPVDERGIMESWRQHLNTLSSDGGKK